MAVISHLTEDNESTMFVSVKGAPETLHNMFKVLPDNYPEIHKEFARQGSRVLALGYKKMSVKGVDMNSMQRDTVESDLIFAGFLIFRCPLKPDAVAALKSLRESSHRNVMITGDNPLTACHIAKEVGIVQKPCIILDSKDGTDFPQALADLEWRSVDEKTVQAVQTTKASVEALLAKFDVCLTGRAFDLFRAGGGEGFATLLPHVRVYSRTSPEQKETVITSLKKRGFITLMCGDGTNDVGALKQAEVGIALLDGKPEDLEKIVKARAIVAAKKRKAQMDEMKRQMEEARNMDPNLSRAEKAKKQRESAMAAAKNALSEIDDDMPVIKLGDASIAAPFTSKISHVSAVCHIIRQGRSALVTTIQMYKILALNCLITAYGLSVLYLDGIKYGDVQMTVSGILLSVCFLSISKNTVPVTLSLSSFLSSSKPQYSGLMFPPLSQ